MSKKFVLIALFVCGTIFALHLALWLYLLIHEGDCPTGVTMLTLVSGFATGMYWLYYKAKNCNENNRLRRN